MTSFDLTRHRVITMEDIDAAGKAGAKELVLQEHAILTPSAREGIAARGLSVKSAASSNGASPTGAAAARPAQTAAEWERLFHSPEAEAIKQEIANVGRKLWRRQYVDGNGGNISYRLTNEAVLCTPTLTSKADLKPEDMCLVDLEGNQLAGGRPRTSEILMHLEIYKSVPEARGIVHCHPVHATAYAITGSVPPTCIIPEFEVFVGRVALSPYETPGTQKFAETVLPFVKKHNTVLLANHGIVCWADTVTHAEWYAEVVDTYCWTLTVAKQLGAPITHIPSEKASDLIAIKQRLGLPDARIDSSDCQMCELPEQPGGITVRACGCPQRSDSTPAAAEIESIVQAVTDAVMASLDGKASQ